MCFRLYEDLSRPFLNNNLRTLCQRIKIAEDKLDKMRTVSEKYANSYKYYMDDTDFFSTDFRADWFQIVRDCTIVSIVNNRENIRLCVTGA